MRKLFIIALVQLPIFGLTQEVPDRGGEEAVHITYVSRFNTDFERGAAFRHFRCALIGEGRGSDFYMLPDSAGGDHADEVEMLMETDTVFRVVKDLDGDFLLFSDIGIDGRTRHYRDTLHPMTWKLLPEKRRIGDMECEKAVALFRGRSYTAWYAPSIPIANGPWKLGGLPGLIVEAYEDNMDMHFILTEIRFIHADGMDVHRLLQRSDMPGYSAFVRYWKEAFRVLQGSMAGRESPDCVSCHVNTKVRFYSWEKIEPL